MVLLGLRTFGVEKKHEIGPLSKDELAKLPVVLYIPGPETSEAKLDVNAAAASAATAAVTPTPVDEIAPTSESQPSQRRRHILRLFFQRRSRRNAGGTTMDANTGNHTGTGYALGLPHPLHPLPANLSTCPICLTDYEAPPLAWEARGMGKEELKKRISELESLNLLPCGHAIHKDCLTPWLQTSGAYH